MTRSKVIEIFAALLVLLFVYAASSKLLNIPQSTFELFRQPLPRWSIPFLVWAIPIGELLISIALMFKKTRTIGFYASFALLTIFTGYIILGLANAFSKVPCSCGGIISGFTWTQHLIFNLFFVAVSLAGIILVRKQFRRADAFGHAILNS